MDSQQLKKCVQLESRYVCEQNFPSSIMNENASCEAKLLIRPNHVPSTSEQRIMKLQNSIFIQLATPNSWLFICP